MVLSFLKKDIESFWLTLKEIERVEEPLSQLLGATGKWRAKDVREQVVPQERKIIELNPLTPSLAAYDALLEGEVSDEF